MFENSRAQHQATRRRALFAGAAGLAGAAVLATADAEPAAADTVSLDWYNVKDHGATGDGSTDDTSSIQAAITLASQNGGGTVYFPEGTYLVTPAARTTSLSSPSDLALAVPSNICLRGSNQRASTLVKKSAGTLLSLSGTGPSADTSSSAHVEFSSICDLGFDGNGQTGLLIELYYCDNIYLRDLYLWNNLDTCIDAVEFWDSRIYNLTVGASTGTANSTNQPNMWVRCSAAASGTWGYSGDSSNQVHLIGCRFEGFGTGALWIGQGTGSVSGPNSIYVTDCKFETSVMQGGPHMMVDSVSRAVHATNIYCYANGYATGYTATVQNMIDWAPQASTLSNVLIANGANGTINSGVVVSSPAGSTSVLRNVVGIYKVNPAGAHIWQDSSTGDFWFDNCHSNSGTALYGGTSPTTWTPGQPLRQVAGAVTDAAFQQTPPNGTMALDTTNDKLYIRVNGTWRSTALS